MRSFTWSGSNDWFGRFLKDFGKGDRDKPFSWGWDRDGKDRDGKDRDGKDRDGKDRDGKDGWNSGWLRGRLWHDRDGKDDDGKDRDGKDGCGKDDDGKDGWNVGWRWGDRDGKDDDGKDDDGCDDDDTVKVGEPNLIYPIVGGPDRALFSVDAMTGAVSFIAPPDFENPLDDGGHQGLRRGQARTAG